MFDKKTIDAWQTIRAPETMKARILQAQPTAAPAAKIIPLSRRGRLSAVAALAACLVMVLGFSLSTPLSSGSGVAIGGVTVTGQPVAVLSADSMARDSAPAALGVGQPVVAQLELTLSGDTQITVSGGGLRTVPRDGQSSQELGAETRQSADTVLCWSIPDALPGQTYTLQLRRSEKTLRYQLSQNAETGAWQLCRAEHESKTINTITGGIPK